MEKKLIQIEVTEDERKRIKVLAASMGITMKQLILRSINKMDNENENRKTNS